MKTTTLTEKETSVLRKIAGTKPTLGFVRIETDYTENGCISTLIRKGMIRKDPKQGQALTRKGLVFCRQPRRQSVKS